MDFVIETERLRKVYGNQVAVRSLDLQVRGGEVFGFLGPNGAGKTTSLKMLLGLASPTSGRALLLGQPPSSRSSRARTGFLPEHFRFHEWLTGSEFLHFHGRLYRIEGGALRQRVSRLLELVGLTAAAEQQLQTYSKGMLQRIGLAQALINEPDVLFLDEPTSGLDPAGRRLVRDIIRDLRAKGTTVFLNSHFLSEVEITCDRVAFLKHGEVLRVDDLKQLAEGSTAIAIQARKLSPEIVSGLSKWGKDIQWNGEILSMTATDRSVLPEITRYLVSREVEIFSVRPEIVSLEELFLKIVGTDGGL